MKEYKPINVAAFEFENEGETQVCAGEACIHRDDAILGTWKVLQSKGIGGHQVKHIYSEWRPSPEFERMIKKEFPNASLTYSFEYGDETAFEKEIQKLHTKKWWEFWKR